MSRDLKVGLFIGGTVILLIAALLYLAMGKGVFEKTHTFTLSSRSGDGFAVGMPVVFSGFDIGKVAALELNDEGLVLIQIKISDRHVKWIRSDSSFILYRPLIGSPQIVVNTVNLKSPPLDESTIPQVSIVNDINDAIARIEPVLEKVAQIAEHTERLTRNLSDPKGDLNRVLGNAEKISTNLASKKSLAEMAISDEESLRSLNESLKKLKDITNNVDRLLVKVDKMADRTDEQLYGALPQVNVILKDMIRKLQKLDNTIDNIDKISSDASAGTKDLQILRSDIDDLLDSLTEMVKKMEDLVGTRKTPEFKTP